MYTVTEFEFIFFDIGGWRRCVGGVARLVWPLTGWLRRLLSRYAGSLGVVGLVL